MALSEGEAVSPKQMEDDISHLHGTQAASIFLSVVKPTNLFDISLTTQMKAEYCAPMTAFASVMLAYSIRQHSMAGDKTCALVAY